MFDWGSDGCPDSLETGDVLLDASYCSSYPSIYTSNSDQCYFDYNNDEFGPDEQQDASFHILRQTLIDLSVVPEIGDILEWNWAHWEINAVNENQLIGGQQDNNWSVTCATYRIRFSNLGVERVRSI